MKVLQILPELNAGGVERGTLELAAHLARAGHEAVVVSHGGRLVPKLQQCGARHLAMAVHRKSPLSLLRVGPLRRVLQQERPDILHIRSRAPGWIAWLAWRKLDPATRPRLVSTVHGFYSVNAYSAVMTRGEGVIAVSESIRDYVLENYPRVNPAVIRVIHRGIDGGEYPPGFRPSDAWLQGWARDQPGLAGKRILTLPARITRWKGQEHFLKIVRVLLDRGMAVHGLIVGEAHPKKLQFHEEIQRKVQEMALQKAITFLGHRPDLKEILSLSDLVFSLSLDPEAFGRTTVEALSMGRPVIGYDHGGVREQLAALLPEGAAPVGDWQRAAELAAEWLTHPPTPRRNDVFLLEQTLKRTVGVYGELLSR